MLDERGLAEATVRRYENTARRFLAQRRRTGEAGPAEGVTSVEVNSFLLAESARCSVGAAKGRVAELRSLLRYLFVRGLTATQLAAAVPPVAGWHNTGIPPTVSPDGCPGAAGQLRPGQAERDPGPRDPHAGGPTGVAVDRGLPDGAGRRQLADRGDHHPRQGPPDRHDAAAGRGRRGRRRLSEPRPGPRPTRASVGCS